MWVIYRAIEMAAITNIIIAIKIRWGKTGPMTGKYTVRVKHPSEAQPGWCLLDRPDITALVDWA